MDLLNTLDKDLLGIVQECGRLADEMGFLAYLVGGPVRDLVLKSSHVDLDIVVEGNGMRLAEKFADAHKGAMLVKYPAFKTATVSLPSGQMVDFASARSETYSKPGVFPAVVMSHIHDDLFRRDFTINAMALEINPRAWGKLVDPFSGMKDLKAKKIRLLHEKSFLDDPTRIVRAARFAARLGFELDVKSLKLLKEAVKNGALDTIKPQRYQKEFNKVLKEKNSKKAIASLKAWDAYRPQEIKV